MPLSSSLRLAFTLPPRSRSPLHRRYPASSVLRACRPPVTARPFRPPSRSPSPRGRPVAGHAPTPPRASRVASCLLCRHAVAITPAELLVRVALLPCKPGLGFSQQRRPCPKFSQHRAPFSVALSPHHPFRGLLGVHCTLRPVCSPSRPCDPLHRRLQPLRCLHDRSDCYRLERPLPGGYPAPTEDTRLFTAH